MKEEPLAASDTRGMAGSALGIDTAHDAVQKAWNLANDDPETVYLWERVEGGPAGLLCPACFTLDAHAKNVSIVWRPVVE